jgi:integrase
LAGDDYRHAARRVCALRWSRVDLDVGVVDVRRSYRLRHGVGVEKDTRLEIDTHIHALRHYSATELLTAGIDLRTVAGRLGHRRGGATTLRVYAAWVAATDRKAAEILGSRMPKRPTPRHVAGDGVDAQ